VITDAELAAALQGRPHWQPTGEDSAVRTRPGGSTSVRVGRIRQPRGHDRYLATMIRDGKAEHAVPFGFAKQASAGLSESTCHDMAVPQPRRWSSCASRPGVTARSA
jgi:hypothetical protein